MMNEKGYINQFILQIFVSFLFVLSTNPIGSYIVKKKWKQSKSVNWIDAQTAMLPHTHTHTHNY